MNDELQKRLRRHDPAADVPVHLVTGPRAAFLLEQIMNTSLTPEAPAVAPRRPRRRVFALAGGATAIAVAVVAFALTRDDSESDQQTTTQVSYVLPAAAGGPGVSMCIRVDAYQPTSGQPAFKGTVTAVGGGTVTLTVSKWYSGGKAHQVVLKSRDGSAPDPVLEGSVAFTVGDEFLVMALDGQVVGCGVSGAVTPELQALYDQWFPG